LSSTNTAIEWTDKTWNPTTGCNKVSPGCKHCYAETITKRFPQHFPTGFKFTLRPDRLKEPTSWRKPSRMFVNSMSDLFHEQMTLEYLQEVFAVMRECDRHVFQILTKRHERLLELAPELDWPENVWMGGLGRESGLRPSRRLPTASSGGGAISFVRTAAGPVTPRPQRDPLGDRWRRIGTGPPSNPCRVGAEYLRAEPSGRGSILLQAVGRNTAEGWGSGTGQTYLRRDA
jgi:hypothetical protein